MTFQKVKNEKVDKLLNLKTKETNFVFKQGITVKKNWGNCKETETHLFFFIKLKKAYKTFKFLPCTQGIAYNLIICPLLLKFLKHLLLPSIKDQVL